MFTQISGEHF